MKRIYELVHEVSNRFDDDFFKNFEALIKINPGKQKAYSVYNRALMILDNESWKILKSKALNHYKDEREGQRKNGFFNILNEAFAYEYLIDKGSENVRFLKEKKGERRPDMTFMIMGIKKYCEVKTINISKNEMTRRERPPKGYEGSIYYFLDKGFFKKFSDKYLDAREQISAVSSKRGLIYIVTNFDDMALDHYHTYKKQILVYARKNNMYDIVIQIGLGGTKTICIYEDSNPPGII